MAVLVWDGTHVFYSLGWQVQPSRVGWHSYITQSVFNVGWQKSIPIQIRQIILYVSNSKGYDDSDMKVG